MRTSMLLCLCAFASALSADRVFTADDKVFEGIVTAFDRERRVVLATGYGNLSFTYASEVRNAELIDYDWPKTSSTRKPTRDARFETWAKERAAKVEAENKAKGLPENWKTISTVKEPNELELAKLTDPINDVKEAANGESEGGQKSRRKSVGEALKGKWAYCCFRIESMKKDENGDIRFDVAGRMFDPHTGKEMLLGWVKGFTVIARKSLDAAAVDAENTKRLEEFTTKWAEEYVIDYERAEKLKAGDGLVFKIVPYFDDAGEDWDRIPTRLAPSIKPRPMR